MIPAMPSPQLRYQLLGRSGLRVSEICLGTMSFGEQWGFGADEATSHEILSAYAEAGGNFLDTANKYHGGETEQFVGSWLSAAAGRRDRMVVATKYTLAMDHSDPNAAGSHRKNLRQSVEASLTRLRTDHIDLLWVHAYDEHTPYEETLRALDDLVRAGKVLYIGISDTPAWVVSAANVTAELRGWTSFAALQIEYSLLQRTPERDLLPMAAQFGLSVIAWAPLGAGVLTGKYTRGEGDGDSLRRKANEQRGRTSERALAIARVVDEVADELGVSSAQVATAWVSAQGYGFIPIVGARKLSQIADTLGAGAVELSPEQLAKLDEVSRIELGFPHDFLAAPGVRDLVHGEIRTRLDPRPRSV
jgi:aryl-alcohol dehydrogenase-like predicted oxidoreductase